MLVFTDQNFEAEALQSRIPVLVDFWAPGCGPCQMATPVIEELATEYEGKIKVGKLNVDDNPKTAAKYGVMSIPTVIVFREGKEVGRKIGFTGKKDYINLMSK